MFLCRWERLSDKLCVKGISNKPMAKVNKIQLIFLTIKCCFLVSLDEPPRLALLGITRACSNYKVA
uniref:Uncharacterized protein n=1 Tax=Arundo donax TaxID=35708 RepID=A0A0A9C0Q5_ARUDO